MWRRHRHPNIKKEVQASSFFGNRQTAGRSSSMSARLTGGRRECRPRSAAVTICSGCEGRGHLPKEAARGSTSGLADHRRDFKSTLRQDPAPMRARRPTSTGPGDRPRRGRESPLLQGLDERPAATRRKWPVAPSPRAPAHVAVAVRLRGRSPSRTKFEAIPRSEALPQAPETVATVKSATPPDTERTSPSAEGQTTAGRFTIDRCDPSSHRTARRLLG